MSSPLADEFDRIIKVARDAVEEVDPSPVDVLSKMKVIQKEEEFLLHLIVKTTQDEVTLPHGVKMGDVLDTLDFVTSSLALLKAKLSSAACIPTYSPDAVCGRVTSMPDCPWKDKQARKYKRVSPTTLPVADQKALSRLDSDIREFSTVDIEAMYTNRSRLLGRGNFGEAWATEHAGKPVALKLLFPGTQVDELLDEVKALMMAGGNDFVIQYIGCCRDARVRSKERESRGKTFSCAIVTELLGTHDGHTNLETLLADTKAILSDYDRVRMALDCAMGLNWLHNAWTPGIFHRDIASKNLFVKWSKDRGYTVKVGDLGLAKKISRRGWNKDHHSGLRPLGTPLTMAPEVMQRHEYTCQADIFSFGMVLWEIWTRNPLETDGLYDLLEQSPKLDEFDAFVDLVVKGFRPTIPPGTPPKLAKLIQQCWHGTAHKRPTIEEVTRTLQNVLVDLAITDPAGRKFWKSNFPGKSDVSWDEFVTKFYAFLGAKDRLPSGADHSSPGVGIYEVQIRSMDTIYKRDEDAGKVDEDVGKTPRSGKRDLRISAKGLPNHKPSEMVVEPDYNDAECTYNCLQSMLAVEHSSKLFVNVTDFGHLISWYGPLIRAEDPRDSFFDRLRDLLKHKWFHGNTTSKPQARGDAGSFRVRESRRPGQFVVEIIVPERSNPVSVRLDRTKDSKFWVELLATPIFDSLPELIEYLQGLTLQGKHGEMKMTLPLEGSPFISLFFQSTTRH